MSVVENKNAIVTGAGSGLGSALTAQLTTQGYHVAALGRTESKLEKLAAQYKQVTPFQVDLSCEKDVKQIFSTLANWQEPFTKVFCCAGSGKFGPIGEYNQAAIQQMVNDNLLSMMLVAQAAIGLMCRQHTPGLLINVMSSAAQIGKANETVYCAMKWGCRGFTEALRAELADTNIKVVGVYPSGMKTDFWQAHSVNHDQYSHYMNPDEVASVIMANLQEMPSCYTADIVINKQKR
ncbi:SDR family NAD(P)-dependent oxidoreductase [Zooshikella marina]|uniref:SDR family NAD(P)-dependent oxidoreductase n=1 Tax=Zooshikella ganghwensis TaxID=202772 RepID=UPI001BAF4B9B|nr:SDR family NAD(P)-dependent oxidoreductase [Zooshikella ganghwensis]MBU2708293.1 SDR family NAD(P)-dependent oxidoreductase [Zooshikella ganghwensis]